MQEKICVKCIYCIYLCIHNMAQLKKNVIFEIQMLMNNQNNSKYNVKSTNSMCIKIANLSDLIFFLCLILYKPTTDKCNKSNVAHMKNF